MRGAHSAGRRASASLTAALPALVVYGVEVLMIFALRARHVGWSAVKASLGAWDSVWYMDIATGGYPTRAVFEGEGARETMRYAFFPMFPMLGRLADAVLPGHAFAALLAVSVVAAVLASWGIHSLMNAVGGRWVAFFAVALWGLVPRANILVHPYSESTCIAAVAWSLWCVGERRWLAAGAFAFVAGLTRPAALPLLVVLWVCWLTGRRLPGPLGRMAGAFTPVVDPPERRRRLAGAALGTVGGAAWVGWIAVLTGGLLGYVRIQNELWGMRSSLPTAVPSWAIRRLSEELGSGFLRNNGVTMLVVALALVGLVALFRSNAPGPWLLFSSMVCWISLSTASPSYMPSVARFLLLAFPLLYAPARVLARRPGWGFVVLAVVAVVTIPLNVDAFDMWPAW